MYTQLLSNRAYHGCVAEGLISLSALIIPYRDRDSGGCELWKGG